MDDRFWEIERLRFENARKWDQYIESGKPFTEDVIKEMHDDNERIGKMSLEATKEWLQEKINRGELADD